MRGQSCQVQQSLPSFLTKAGLPSAASLASLAPLEISSSDGIRSYKETWSPANCKASVAHSNMYEAGGSLYWLCPGLCSNGVLLIDEPPYAEVLEAEEVLCSAQGDGSRYYFPDAFACYAERAVLTTGDLPAKLFLINKHTLVYAWYIAMAKACLSTDIELIKQLHQMALTVTVRVLSTTDTVDVTLESLTVNERSKQGNTSDTFIMFARKVQALENHFNAKSKSAISKKDLLSTLLAKGVRFNGAKLNRTILEGAQKTASMMTDNAVSLLSKIQREFGREVFSNHYSKLTRLCARCSKQTALWENVHAGASPERLLELTLEVAYVALARGQCAPDFFCVQTIDPTGDEVGWAAGTFAKIAVVQQVVQMAEVASQQAPVGKLKDEAREVAEVVKKLGTPLSYHVNVPQDISEDSAAPEENALEQKDPLAVLTQNLPAGKEKAAEFIRDVWEGDFESDVVAIAHATNPCSHLLKPDESSKLGQALRACTTVMALDPAGEDIQVSKNLAVHIHLSELLCV